VLTPKVGFYSEGSSEEEGLTSQCKIELLPESGGPKINIFFLFITTELSM
jgi:hypothetical protein